MDSTLLFSGIDIRPQNCLASSRDYVVSNFSELWLGTFVGRKGFSLQLSSMIHDLICAKSKGTSVFAGLLQSPTATGVSSTPVFGWSSLRGK